MKAVVCHRYGSPETLTLREIDEPSIRDNQALIAVRAVGLEIADCFVVRGAPLPVRLMSGWLRPRYGVPGMAVSGEVVQIGPAVKRLRVGDAVFGACYGACAEAVAAPEDTLALKPANLSWEEAAAAPTSALAALHALRDTAGVQPGWQVLINGASGGVGSFAVQLAKYYGAEVTGVCSAKNVELVRSLGARHVVDYEKEDFTGNGRRYDLILDNVENRSLADCRRALKPGGVLILNSGTGASGIAFWARLIRPLALSPFVRHKLRRYFSEPNLEDLIALKKLLEARKISPVIDRVYPLAETPAALLHIEAGHARGKVVDPHLIARLTPPASNASARAPSAPSA